MKKSNLFKRILAYTLVLSIVFSQIVFTSGISATEKISVWDGTKAESFAGGDGTADSPFLIETAEQLYKMVVEYDSYDASKDKYFSILNDIYINEVNADTEIESLWGKNNWLADYGNEINAAGRSNTFSGTLDGKGHTIYGLYANASNKKGACLGLFPAISDHASIKNLNFNKLFLTGGSGSAGAIAGHAYWKVNNHTANISNCSVVDAIIGQLGNIESIGGFVGNTNDCTITFTDCYTKDVELSLYDTITPGGITGNAWSGGTVRINNCYSAGYFPVRANITKAKCTNVYTDAAIPEGNTTVGVTVLTADQMKGAAAKTNMSGFDFDCTWQIKENDYPELKYIEFWDGTTDTSFLTKYAGTAEDPYIIENGAQLRGMVDQIVAYSDVSDITTPNSVKRPHYKIVNDIYLNPVTEADMVAARASAADGVNDGVAAWNDKGYKTWRSDWTSSSGFYGEVDGCGHTIYGVYSNTTYAGLINDTVGNTVIKNINLKNSYLYGKVAGGIVGQPYGKNSTLTVIGCSVDNTAIEGAIKADNYTGSVRVAGIVGGADNTIKKIAVSYCSVTNMTFETYNTSYPEIESAFIGYVGAGDSHNVSNCYSDNTVHPVCNVTDKKDNFATIANRVNYKNVYTTYPETFAEAGVVTVSDMKGDAAKTNMAGFNFDNAWQTVDGGYPVLRENAVYVWGGGYDIGFKGAGTKESPYIIESPEQLAYVVSIKGVAYQKYYFELANDIIINDTSKADWKTNAFNWAWGDVRFQGNFDGQGYTIDGLYFNGSQKRFGLFSFVGDSVFTNFKMTNAYVYNTVTSDAEGVAIVAGQTSAAATFDRIYIDENSYVNAPSTKGVAGIVGRGNVNVDITNCAVLGTFEGLSHVGSFYGTYWGGVQTVNNSFSASNVPMMPSRALQNSANNYATVINEEFDIGVSVLTAEQMKGKAAKENMTALNFNYVWKVVEGDYPVLRPLNDEPAWDGTKADNFAGGTGTAEDPYLIENGGQLYKMVAEYSNADVAAKPETQTYFKLTKDINLGGNKWYTHSKWKDDMSNEYYTTGFNGIIYGEGHTIYGLTINGTNAYSSTGFIPVATQGAAIYDLHLEGGKITQTAWNGRATGAFIGLAVGVSGSAPIVFDGCSVKDFTVKGTYGSSAFVGYTYSQSIAIKNSYCVDADLSHTSATNANSGAFVGYTGGNGYNNTIVVENSHSADVSPIIYLCDDTYKGNTTFTNVYTANEAYDNSVAGLTKLTVAQMTGVAAKENLKGFNFNQIWQYGAEGEYPTHKSEEIKAMYWNGTAADNFAGGEGTIDNPFEVSTAEELYLLANSDTESTAGKYFELTKNIEISATYEGWENENPYSWTNKTAYLDGFAYSNSFAGTLNGNGYTVSGLYYNDVIDNGNYAYGLIPLVTADAVIKNLNVENVAGNTIGDGYVGAVVGAAHVTAEDAVNPFKMIQIVGVNVTNSDLALLGGATRGVKIELCNAENLIGIENENVSVRNCNGNVKYDDNVVIYNTLNADSTTLVTVRKNLLGYNNYYITDINGDATFDVRDIVSAKKALTMQKPDEILVWSDEFDGSSLNYSVWSTNTNSMSRGSTLEYADNSTVNDGTLTLACKDTGKTNDNGDKIYSVNYGLDTANKMSFKYGRLEMCAKIPFGAGAFPSLWLSSRNAIGSEKITEFSTEVDILEVFGKTNANDTLVTCLHKWYNDENGVKTGYECSSGTGWLDGNNKVPESERSYLIKGDAQNDFHTFVFEWDKDSMSFSVDGNVYYTASRSDMDNFDLNGYNTNSDGIFNQPLYILINNQMYTTGQDAAYSYTGSADDIDASKLNYEIDYIRLYQKTDGESEITFK